MQPKTKMSMKKNKVKKKEEARDFFHKIIENKKAMIACIENDGDIKVEAKKRRIELANPLSVL